MRPIYTVVAVFALLTFAAARAADKPIPPAAADAPLPLPAKVHYDDLSGDEAQTIIIALGRSSVAASVVVPLMNKLSAQLTEQAKAEAAKKNLP